jgi:hypothetical protein
MTKRIALILALWLGSTLASAECDFPYYPEFADRFCEYEEVTPLMAKKSVMSAPFGFQHPGDIVCEPLLIKTVVGMPAYYMVATYAGDDLDVVRKWNAFVNKLNTGSKIPAKELAAELAFFFDEEVFRQFAWDSVHTYTFLGEIKAASGGIPPAFWGYEGAYEKAKELYGNDGFDFVRIIALGHAHVQAFEFADASGKMVTLEVDKYGRAEVTDLEKTKEEGRDWVSNWYALFEADPGLIERNVGGWRKLEVTDEDAQKEFPQILDRE